MENVMMCSVKDALKLLEHMNDDDMVTLTIFTKKNFQHKKTGIIKKKEGEELINEADLIEYQDNDFFGRLSLYGVVPEKEVIHNLLFAQQLKE